MKRVKRKAWHRFNEIESRRRTRQARCPRKRDRGSESIFPERPGEASTLATDHGGLPAGAMFAACGSSGWEIIFIGVKRMRMAQAITSGMDGAAPRFPEESRS